MCGLLSSVDRARLEMRDIERRRARRAAMASIMAASLYKEGKGDVVNLFDFKGLHCRFRKISLTTALNGDINITSLGRV